MTTQDNGGFAKTDRTDKPERVDEFPFWRSIYDYVRDDKGSLALSVFFTLIVGWAMSTQNLIIRWVVDEGVLLKGPDGQDAPLADKFFWVLVWVGVYVLASGSRMFFWYLGYSRFERVKETFLLRLRTRFFRHIQHLCLRFHDQVSSGELFAYIFGTPLQTLAQFLQQFVMHIANALIQWGFTLAVLLWMDVPMTMILLGTTFLNYALARRSRDRLKEMSANFMQVESEVSGFVADMLRGTRAVKLYTMERQVTGDFDEKADLIRFASFNLTMRRWLENAKPEAVRYLGLGLLMASGAYSVVYRGLELGKYMTFIVNANAFLGPMGMLLNIYFTKASAEAALERIHRILRRESSTVEKAPPRTSAVRTQLKSKESSIRLDAFGLEFRDVTFSYRDKPVLKNLNIVLEPRESVALVGKSGSGKSTFAKLILRLYEPESGEILLGGRDVRTFALEGYRAAFGVVPQDPFLFRASIAENIRVARPDATMEEVREAARLAHALEFIEEMPEGFDATAGEGGANLSGGQRQRIAIARAILADPDFFIFDEATSALDNQSERVIQSAIEHLMSQKLTVIVAHRLSTIRNVDRILVFEDGVIAQDGSYDELAAQPGPFRDLEQASQSESESDGSIGG